MATIHAGDVGTVFRDTLTDDDTDAAIDVSAATSKVMWFTNPDGDTVEFEAAFTTDGTDGSVQYVTAAPTDLDPAGSWKFQAFVAGPGYEIHGDVHKFKVLPNLGPVS